MSLAVKTYRPKDAIFPVASTVIYGKNEAILIDAQFQVSRAKELVQMIRGLGRNLTTVFISYHDPDYYFGLQTIREAFPDIRILSTPQTAWLIGATHDAKLAVWKDQMGADAPSETIVPQAMTAPLTLEGEQIEVRQAEDDAEHSFLWIPSLKTALGGIPVATGAHLWMADTQTLKAVDKWVARLDDMAALGLDVLIPGHAGGDTSTDPATLDFVRTYLRDWRAVAETAKTADDIVAAMTQKYPDLPGKDSLTMGAVVFMGDTPWEVVPLFPAVGRKVRVDFGKFVFELDFRDNRTMSFVGTEGLFVGVKDTVEYTAVPVGPSVWMVYWIEPVAGANVVHVHNYGTGKVWTNIAGTDLSFTNVGGTLTLL